MFMDQTTLIQVDIDRYWQISEIILVEKMIFHLKPDQQCTTSLG